MLLAIAVAAAAVAMLAVGILRERLDRPRRGSQVAVPSERPRAEPGAAASSVVVPATSAHDRLWLGAAALVVAIGAAAIGTIESLVYLPTLHYRSVMAILPVLYLGLGLSLTAPFGRWAAAAGIGIAAVLAAVAVVTPPPALYAKDDWRAGAAIVRRERDAGLGANRIVLVAPWNQREWLVELNNTYGRPAPVSDLPSQLQGLEWIADAPEMEELPQDAPLLMVAFHFWRWEEHAAIVDTTRAHSAPVRTRACAGSRSSAATAP